jgi:hypothetical protein
MLLYLVFLGGAVVLLAAAVGALREAIRQRARLRGILLTVGLAVLSLLAIWAILV